MAIAKIILNGVVQMDVTGDTVASGNLLSGYTATGADGQSVSGGITSQGATTYNVSSSDQTISAGKYLTGAQTIRGVTVSDTLVAANVKDGVTVKIGDAADDDRILSVTGTLSGGGGSYTRTEILPSQSFTPGSDRRATLSGMTGFVDGGYYIVTYDGVEWLTTCDLLWSVDYCIGEVQWLFGTPDSACPFCVVWESGTNATVAIGNTSQHTIKIERLEFISGPSSGGLVYETGTFTPAEDIVRPTITFANTHTEPPMFAMVSDTTGVYDDTANTMYEYVYADWYRFAGYGAYASSTTQNFGLSFARQRTTNTTSLASSSSLFTNNSDVSTDSPSTFPRYYVSETYLKPQGSTTVYFRVGHTYKWIAVWKPTT